jgi:hypothetical protein
MLALHAAGAARINPNSLFEAEPPMKTRLSNINAVRVRLACHNNAISLDPSNKRILTLKAAGLMISAL